MEIIPVIDLMHGQVVHARFGQRQDYQPIKSLLCRSSAPMDVVNALLELYPFERIYIADLNAIQGQNNHFQTIQAINNVFPQLTIWLDSGISCANDLKYLKNLRVSHVIGTENINSVDDLICLKQALNEECILSLDFNAQGFLGPTDLLNNPQYWPKKIIAMALNKVGSHQGADLMVIESLINQKLPHEFYAAGGVRNLEDLAKLSKLNTSGALLASALHNKHLSSADIIYASNEL